MKYMSSDNWFASGETLPYDATTKEISYDASRAETLRIFTKTVTYADKSSEPILTLLGGFPNGSIDWITIDPLLEKERVNRMYIEFVGQGNSDKPTKYAYSTFERADVVEAVWKAKGITSTMVVTFDYSSLVVLELLRRKQERVQIDEKDNTAIDALLLINGGYFTDGHSHPLMTTPLLTTPIGKVLTTLSAKYPSVFKRVAKTMFSEGYEITEAEMEHMRGSIQRQDGFHFLHTASRFVQEHKKSGRRLDMLSIVKEMNPVIPIHIIGSAEDVFEPRQVVLARERLTPFGVEVSTVPGGHSVTFEQPEIIAKSILALIRSKN